MAKQQRRAKRDRDTYHPTKKSSELWGVFRVSDGPNYPADRAIRTYKSQRAASNYRAAWPNRPYTVQRIK